MKKTLMILAVIAAMCALSGCGNTNSEGSLSDDVSSSAPESNSSEADTLETKDESKIESKDNSEADSNSRENAEEANIKIASWNLSTDYQGSEVLVVEYEWTNIGDDDISFMTAFTTAVYQNGIECETAILCDDVDSEALLNSIKPGTTYNVKKAYVLQDKTTANVIVKKFLGDTLIDDKIDLGGGEGAAAPNGEIAETSVKISDYKISTDYKDESILVVNYEFYNGEDSAKAFTFIFTDKAFQNGVECDSMVIGCDDIDSNTQLNEIQPGISYIVSVGYHISDMSNVELEITNLFGTKTYLEETISLS